MIIRLIKIPRNMMKSEKLALSDIIVVSVPEPAISGKAIGTSVAAFTSFSL